MMEGAWLILPLIAETKLFELYEHKMVILPFGLQYDLASPFSIYLVQSRVSFERQVIYFETLLKLDKHTDH